jgi:hypothetical protein
MSTRTKVLLIAVAVLVVVLFAAAAANQAGTGTGDANSRSGLVDSLKGRAGSASAVVDGEIETDCRQAPNTFRFNGSCTLTVAPGGAALRSLVLRAGNAVTVTSRVPRKDFTVDDDLAAGEQVQVAIDDRGGPVALRCASLSPCVVTIEDGQ